MHGTARPPVIYSHTVTSLPSSHFFSLFANRTVGWIHTVHHEASLTNQASPNAEAMISPLKELHGVTSHCIVAPHTVFTKR